MELARGQIEKYYHRPPLTTLLRKLFYYEILPHPGRLQFVGRLLRFYQRSGLEKLVLASGVLKLLPGRLDQVARLAPRMENPFFYERLGKTFPAEGKQRYRVALFAGCIANLSFARLNDATVRVLTKNGCEVVVPREQGCCGALHVHAGIRGIARDLAKRNIDVFQEGEFDAVISNAAGCGSVLKEYPLWSHTVSLLVDAQLTHCIGLNDLCDSLQLHSGPRSTIREAIRPVATACPMLTVSDPPRWPRNCSGAS